VHAVYEACGFGFALQRKLSALGIRSYVVCPQKLDEQNKRVKTDGLDVEAQGRSLMVNQGIEPVKSYWWKRRNFAALPVPAWIKELLGNTQPVLLALHEKIGALTRQLQEAAQPKQPRGLGAMSSVIIDREIGDWKRFQQSTASGQLHRLMSRRIQ
jgi:transposase